MHLFASVSVCLSVCLCAYLFMRLSVRVFVNVAQWCLVLFLWTQWEPVEYFDNKIICDLVESKPNGIIAIMVSWISTTVNPVNATYTAVHAQITMETVEQYCIEKDKCPSNWLLLLLSIHVYFSDTGW